MTRFLFTLTIFLSLTVETLYGQTYNQLIKQADSLCNAKEFKKSNEVYQQAFKIEKKSPNDLYNAACSAALAGDTKKSFEFLELALLNGWINIDHLKKDNDLDNLHSGKKWKPLVDKMQIKIDSIEANYDKPLQKELLQIFRDDQEIRIKYLDVAKKLGYNNPTVDSLGRVMFYTDSIDLIKVTQILERNGW